MVNFTYMQSQEKIGFFFLLVLICFPVLRMEAEELYTVTGSITSSRPGTVYLQIVDEAGFNEEETGFFRGAIIEISSPDKSPGLFTLENIPPGTYGIRSFLDTNGNGKIDFSLRGIEPWGTYRPVRPFMRGPRFREISFFLDGNLEDIEVILK